MGGELVGDLSGDSSVASHDAGAAIESAPDAVGLSARKARGVSDWGDCGERCCARGMRGFARPELDAPAWKYSTLIAQAEN